jgi:hypothetical protein
MAIRVRGRPTPEECIAALKLDTMGVVVLSVALSISGVILGLLARVISG